MKSYEQLFGINLQKLRLGKSMSQRRLGELIGFSDKTISKWECGGGIPDIAVLYKLTDIFKVRLDDLFAEDTVYYLGIDGGGTKTVFCLADKDLNILRQEKLDCCNPIDIGLEASTKILRDGITKICDSCSTSKIYMYAGIAGGTSGNFKTSLKSFFNEFGFLAYENDSDNRNIIEAGLGNRNGISMVMGTGVCVFCQKDGVCKRYSGWGYLFDNGASAYNIGRDGLVAHFEALDGFGRSTVISDILNEASPNTQTLLAELYRGGKKEIASYARVVYTAAKENDPVAISILRENMKFGARVIETAAASLSEEVIPVVLTGGLTTEKDTLKYLREALTQPEHYNLQVLSHPPVYGALLLARKLARQTGIN